MMTFCKFFVVAAFLVIAFFAVIGCNDEDDVDLEQAATDYCMMEIGCMIGTVNEEDLNDCVEDILTDDEDDMDDFLRCYANNCDQIEECQEWLECVDECDEGV